MIPLQQPAAPRLLNNRFEILDTLSPGEHSKIKRAIDRDTGRAVALQIFNTVAEDDPTRIRRLHRRQAQADAMRRCSAHPNIVTIHDTLFSVPYPKRDGEVVEKDIFVRELCEMGDLYYLLGRDELLPPIVCQEYFRQMMSGIKFCHDQGVCHRNLKPENLLLDANCTLKIGGFGFAASGRTNMLCRSFIGTLSYMAPEVVRRRTETHADDPGYDGAKADVWSMGVILFTMLAGHPPLEKAMETDWWFRALKVGRLDLFWQSHERFAARFPEGTRFPEGIKGLVSKMLRVDPDDRISVDEIMRDPYFAD